MLRCGADAEPRPATVKGDPRDRAEEVVANRLEAASGRTSPFRG